MLTITPEDPSTPDCLRLIEELSDTLRAMTGDSGRASFDVSDVRLDRARFVLARNAHNEAVGCGAFRPLGASVAEIKRMYARPGNPGVGSAILAFLESEAAALGYDTLRLETRLVNARAVCFYERHHYVRIANYGSYAGNAHAVCFEKKLMPAAVSTPAT